MSRTRVAGVSSPILAAFLLVLSVGLASAQTAPPAPAAGSCPPKPWVAPLDGPTWNGWGVDTANTRFQAAASAGLTAANVPKLSLQWAYGFPDGHFAAGQVTVAGGRLFVGTGPGAVYSIDAASGCTYWVFRTHAIVRSAVALARVPGSEPARYAAYFGDLQGNVYAVDAETGTHLWTKRIDTHPHARVTGSPTVYEGRVYVPLTYLEEAAASTGSYACCTGRGQVVAYEAATGNEVWRSYMIDETPKPTRVNSAGVQMWGPAGAGVWSAPTVDAARGLLYVATGDAYTSPAAATSDAVIALDIKTGRKVWVQQVLAGDAYIAGCTADRRGGPSPNCPETLGPDFDFGQSPVLRRLPSGKDVLVIGQKSGQAWAFDPDKGGARVWEHRIGVGDLNGGLQWGLAADATTAYIASSDITKGPEVAGGLAALASGRRLWYVRPPARQCGDQVCVQAQSAAVTAIPGVVFSGSTNGVMRAYAAGNGQVLWEHDTIRDYVTVNGVPAKGGRIDGAGPAVVDGRVYFHSGYGMLRGGLAGNVLLAFGVR
jgi:polyvinyl alcohol dehydrogenase (cytochrome)